MPTAQLRWSGSSGGSTSPSLWLYSCWMASISAAGTLPSFLLKINASTTSTTTVMAKASAAQSNEVG